MLILAALLLAPPPTFPYDAHGLIVIHATAGVPVEYALATGYDHSTCMPLIATTPAHERTLADASEFEVIVRVKGRRVVVGYRWCAVVDQIGFNREEVKP